jgi:outer membrane protein TolC
MTLFLLIAAAGFGSPPDTTLIQRLRTLIAERSPALAAHRARVEAAEALVRAAGFAPAASLALDIEEVPDGADVTEAGSVRLELSKQLLTGGRRRAQRAVAAADAAAARARLATAERQLAALVDELVVRASGTTAIGARLAAEDSLLGSAEEALRSRFAVGEARYVDVLRLRTERLRTRIDRAAALTSADLSVRRILALGGAAPDSLEPLSALLDSVLSGPAAALAGSVPPPAPALDTLVAGAPLVREAAAGVSRAQATRSLTAAEQRPLVTAGLGAQRFGEAEGHSIGPTLAVNVSLPFTAGRANRLARDAAERQVAAATTAREAALTRVRAALSDRIERYEAARRRFAEFDAALLSGAAEERESALAAYEAGQLSLLELIDFERAIARAEIARLESRVAAAEAYAELFAGEPADEQEIWP